MFVSTYRSAQEYEGGKPVGTAMIIVVNVTHTVPTMNGAKPNCPAIGFHTSPVRSSPSDLTVKIDRARQPSVMMSHGKAKPRQRAIESQFGYIQKKGPVEE